MISFSLYRSSLLLVATLLPPAWGRCRNSPTAPMDQLPQSDLVVRLRYNSNAQSTLPCPVSVWEAGSPSTTTATGFSQYTILDVYKQSLLDDDDEQLPPDWVPFQAGDTITVIYSTDTGFQKRVPYWIAEDPDGFVAYLHPYRYCQSGEDAYDTLATENLRANPFSLNQCNRGNRPWSDLNSEERAYLTSQSDLLVVTNNSTLPSNSTLLSSSWEDLDVAKTDANNRLLGPDDEEEDP